MKLGFLYAGQGSQHAGMGADLYEQYPAFRAVIDSAEVDFDLKKVSFEDPDGIINQTRYTQPCMVAFAAGLTACGRKASSPLWRRACPWVSTPPSTPPACSTPPPPSGWWPSVAVPWKRRPPAGRAP